MTWQILQWKDFSSSLLVQYPFDMSGEGIIFLQRKVIPISVKHKAVP